jgi:ABC-type multidrug transport system fused ATPase/permease subunit
MLMLSVKRVFDAAFPTAGARSIEQGTHAGLLAREGAYARLHALQFGDA